MSETNLQSRAANLFVLLSLLIAAPSLATAQQAPPVWTIDLFKPADSQPNQLSAADKFRIDLYGPAPSGGKVKVPSLKGLAFTDAAEKLRSLNLQIEKKNEEGLSVDLVDYQNPQPGAEVEMGTAVGVRLVTRIPDVTGKPLGDAYDQLKDAGFKVKYFQEWDKDYDVTGQIPRSGGMDIRGKTITLQCNVAVPDVTGKTVAEASRILEQSDLFAEISAYYQEDDLVYAQGHKPGRMIPRRFTVELRPGVKVPDVRNVDVSTAELRLVAQGIPAKIVGINKVATFNANEHGRTFVTAQAVRPGDFIFRGNTLELKVTQLVYQQLRLPEIRIQPIDYGDGGYQKPVNIPANQTKCPDCGRPSSQCKCFIGG